MVEEGGGRSASAPPPADVVLITPSPTGAQLRPASEVEAKPRLAETNRANGGRSRAAASMPSSTSTNPVADKASALLGGVEAVPSRRERLGGGCNQPT
ncbi:MAG: hypothetical protein JW846_06175 [Dehalococcoidia bacterium]|nr:hypothetical protein [Dehalococcoidia bacterium]